jgi:hypothetical protein
MAKTAVVCPFTKNTCTECPIYRGRHHYLSFFRGHQGSTDNQKAQVKRPVVRRSIESQPLKKSVGPYLVLPPFPHTGKHSRKRSEPEIKLKVIDVESRTTRICSFNETKEWSWDNPELMRIIDGWQVTSMEMLLEIMYQKAEKGYEEVELYEAPRFMLLAGG